MRICTRWSHHPRLAHIGLIMRLSADWPCFSQDANSSARILADDFHASGRLVCRSEPRSREPQAPLQGLLPGRRKRRRIVATVFDYLRATATRGDFATGTESYKIGRRGGQVCRGHPANSRIAPRVSTATCERIADACVGCQMNSVASRGCLLKVSGARATYENFMPY